MATRAAGITLIGALIISGCATVTPPPERMYWDEVPASTQCTDNASGTGAQYVGSLLASGVGGFDIGAGIATGYFPLIGISLATIGILGSIDSGQKFDQIQRCKEFKEYVSLRETSASAPSSAAEGSLKAQLEELNDLLSQGILSEEEHARARARVLDSYGN